MDPHFDTNIYPGWKSLLSGLRWRDRHETRGLMDFTETTILVVLNAEHRRIWVPLSGSHETSANQLSVSLYRRIATKGREENCSSGTGVDSFTLPGQSKIKGIQPCYCSIRYVQQKYEESKLSKTYYSKRLIFFGAERLSFPQRCASL